MPLTEFEVIDHQPDIDGSVVITAKDSKQKVLAFIGRRGLEYYSGEYLWRLHLSYKQWIFLLRSPNNLSAVAKTFSEKHERDETSFYHAYGSTLPRVDIELADLGLGPPLEGHRDGNHKSTVPCAASKRSNRVAKDRGYAPDELGVTRAWASVSKVIEALKELCPNHPEISPYR